MSEAVGAGLTLKYDDVGGSDFTDEIANIINFEFPETTSSDIKNTKYGTTGTTHDYIAGFKEGGEVVVTKDFAKADETTLRGLHNAGTRKVWKSAIAPKLGDTAQGGSWQFEGYINKLGPALPVDEKLTQKFSIKVCTAPAFTPAS